MKRVTRKITRVSYFEPEEPSFDEYIFCSSCGDYVYEYCSIHGPLLVIPDSEVPTPTGLPSFVPRAALTIPSIFLHLGPSTIPDAGIGVFSTLTLPPGVRFGPYRGLKTDQANSPYCWQIFDDGRRPAFVLDARDPDKSNWMRYVNCSRHSREQNLVAFQYQGQLYYRTMKTVPRFTELLVFYGSEYANRLDIDLRRYNSPMYTEILVKFDARNEEQKNESNFNTQNVDIDPSAVEVKEDFIKNAETYEDTEENCETVFPLPNKPLSDIHLEDLKTNDVDGAAEEKVKPAKYVCDICGRSFNEKAAITDHISTHNATEAKNFIFRVLKFSCSKCDSKFATRSDLINHDIKIHDSKINYQACNICDYKTTHSRIKEHMERHSGIRKYKCDICEHAAYTAGDIKKHKIIHLAPNGPHICLTCGKKFSVKYYLNRHLRNCGVNHKCNICGQNFSSLFNLRRHNKIHDHQIPNYSCQICDSQFNNKRKFLIHSMIHTGVNQPTCTVCGKKFVSNSRLNAHIKIHSDEQPYKCDKCGKGFVYKSRLDSHYTSHSLEKPFKCEQCNKGFKKRYSLKKHLKMHCPHLNKHSGISLKSGD